MEKNISKNGFSFVELIVVITIIALLTTVAVVSFQSISLKSRDSRRISDLEKIRIALESYRRSNNQYPSADGNGMPTGLVPGYMPKAPSDPSPTYSYYYELTTPYTYNLYAHMEDTDTATGTYGSNCGGVCNYQVTNP